MRHRVIPAMFWTATFLSAVLMVLPGLREQAVAGRPLESNLRNIAIGLFNYTGVSANPTTETGILTIELDRQHNRRFQGMLALSFLEEGWTQFDAINITNPRPNLVIAQGIGDSGRFLLRGDFTSFAGGVQVADLQTQFLPVGRLPTLGRAVTLAPFADPGNPPVAGAWTGSFQCDLNPDLSGFATLVMGAPDDERLSFQGTLSLSVDSFIESQDLALQALGTINQSDHRIVMIGQGSGGRHRLAAEGAFGFSTEIGAFADLRYRLLFDDQLVNVGTIRLNAPIIVE